MRGLWKYISPFAPDQSGAAAVFFGLGGIVVICDAGGCAGNICGFDEPRWFGGRKSAVFSAGLRDMDAILGRDDKLIDKLCDAAEKVEASFAVIIGTPVPSVIGTDYRALQRMAEKRLHMPILTIHTTGMELYDKGIEEAYLALCQQFTQTTDMPEKDTVGVLGAVPLDLMHADGTEAVCQELVEDGWNQILLYDDLEDFIHAGKADMNIVVSPAGLKAAKYLQKTLGTPYEKRYFGLSRVVPDNSIFAGKNVLIVHQQVAAHAMKALAEEAGAAYVTTATWFMTEKTEPLENDILLREEDKFCELADNDNFDIILGDAYFQKALPHFQGTYVDFPHFAVSGRR